MSLLSVFSTGHGDIVTENIADLFLVPVACAFYVLQKILNLSMNNVIYYFHFDGNYYAGDHIDIHDNTSVNFYQGTKCTHTNGNGTHYPFLRQFGAKHCHFLVALQIQKNAHMLIMCVFYWLIFNFYRIVQSLG